MTIIQFDVAQNPTTIIQIDVGDNPMTIDTICMWLKIPQRSNTTCCGTKS